MLNPPDKKYPDQTKNYNRPSWSASPGFINQEHREIFERTKDIPGWQIFGDTYKLYEMGYFAGDTILEVGTCGGRSAVVEIKGSRANKQRKDGPQYFGIDLDPAAIKMTYSSLKGERLHKNALLFHGDLKAFSKKFSITPTMVFLDGDHRYEGVKSDLGLLAQMLPPGVPILCHDYLNPENDTGEYGVRRALDEWQDEGFAEFFNCFGCSALVITTDKCKGKSRSLWSRRKFRQKRRKLLDAYSHFATFPLPVEHVLSADRSYTVQDFFPGIEDTRPRQACVDIKDPFFWEVYDKCKDYSLLSIERFYNIFRSVEYIANSRIPGDFVECGVFFGGSVMAMALFAKRFGIADRKFYLYDTFAGFPDNTADVDHMGEEVEMLRFPEFREVVRKNISRVDVDENSFVFVEGPVERTLNETAPESICLLRLDTDYYESTLIELQVLYPLLTPRGVLILDDYGYFEGVRKAVDEYLAETGNCMLLNRIDFGGRSGIKPLRGPGKNA